MTQQIKKFTVGMDCGNDKFLPFRYPKRKTFEDATFWADELSKLYPHRRFVVMNAPAHAITI